MESRALCHKAGHSVTKLKGAPHLAEIQFRRGSRSMWVKLSHDQEEFTPLDFLMKKTMLGIPEQLRPAMKGVEWQKRADILTKLSSHATKPHSVLGDSC